VQIAHVMLRVGDLDRSLHFYTRVVGMTLRRRLDFPEVRLSLAFVGYGGDSGGVTLELSYDWDAHGYEMGSAFGHLALAVDDVRAAVEEIRARGGTITQEPHLATDGTTMIAFVADPDGYAIQLVPAA